MALQLVLDSGCQVQQAAQMSISLHAQFQQGQNFKLDPGHWVEFQKHLAQGTVEDLTCQACWNLLEGKDVAAARDMEVSGDRKGGPPPRPLTRSGSRLFEKTRAL